MINRIFRTTFAIAMVILIVALLLFVGILYGYFNDNVFTELEAEAGYIARGIELSGIGYFDDFTTPNRVTYIDRDGDVVYDSSANPVDMENHASRDEIMQALESSKAYGTYSLESAAAGAGDSAA